MRPVGGGGEAGGGPEPGPGNGVGRARNASTPDGPRPARNGGGAAAARPPVRFRFLELAYGCHGRRVEFGGGEEPFVILGPNGAGKSTLVEAAVRVLYGFNRQRKDDRELHDARRPWEGGAYRATLGLEGPFGRVRVERDFETDEVVVGGEDASAPLYEGEANPAAGGRETRAYRELLERLLGLAELDAYERTACLHQGQLIRTRLSEDLLQLAAGGHADVEEARAAIREEHYALTKEPAGEGESRRRKPGEIERLRERAGALEERVAEARAAEERRRPLVEERDAVEARLAALDEEVGRLRDAFRGLSELEKLDARREASRGRIRRLDEARRELDEAIARVDLLAERPPAAPAYPADFLERVAALEEGLWPRRARLAEERARLAAELDGPASSVAGESALTVAAGGLGIAAAAAFLAGVPSLGALALLAAGAVGGWAVWRRVSRSRRRAAVESALAVLAEEAAEVEERIRARLAGVPDADTLALGTLPDRRREFERQRREIRTREEARTGLRGAMDRARAALAEAAEARVGERDEVGETPEASAPEGGASGEESLLRRGRERLARLEEAVREERNERLAPVQLELRQVSRAQFSLPEGVRPEIEAVEAALTVRADEERGLRERLEALVRRLAYEARPEESPVAIRARLREARGRLERLEARAAACRHAFRLVNEAYEEFRRTDQERLLDGVSGHLSRATGGELGPVKARDGQLEEARVESAGRMLPLASPPLSYGQLHSALLAVRLGASDFLAGFGVRLPLIVDDPFVHLDETRAGELWKALGRIARERQVVVATQDRLLLDHLGIRPDLVLDGA